MQNKLRLLLYSLISLCILSCSATMRYRKELKTARLFLKYASLNDSINIQKLIGINSIYFGKDREGINFKVQTISKLIKTYGLPEDSKFRYKIYPSSSYQDVDILIPIVTDGSGRLKKAEIVLYFFKYIGTQKIGYFDLITDYCRF